MKRRRRRIETVQPVTPASKSTSAPAGLLATPILRLRSAIKPADAASWAVSPSIAPRGRRRNGWPGSCATVTPWPRASPVVKRRVSVGEWNCCGVWAMRPELACARYAEAVEVLGNGSLLAPAPQFARQRQSLQVEDEALQSRSSLLGVSGTGDTHGTEPGDSHERRAEPNQRASGEVHGVGSSGLTSFARSLIVEQNGDHLIRPPVSRSTPGAPWRIRLAS